MQHYCEKVAKMASCARESADKHETTENFIEFCSDTFWLASTFVLSVDTIIIIGINIVGT